MGEMAKLMRRSGVEPSSRNIFADLGLPDSVELDTKLRLAIEIVRALDDQKVSAIAVGRILGISADEASALRRYELGRFSLWRLIIILTTLGRDIAIRVRSRLESAAPGRVLVEAG